MNDNNLVKDYAGYRLERAKEDLKAFTIRNASDYDDMFIASRVDTEEQIENAEYILKLVSDYINQKIQNL